jgi:hypothetical protein
MAKNPFGKSRSTEQPYAIYAGYGPFGNTECRVLKTYQTVDNEKTNRYSRWFVAVSSDHTWGGFDMGDSYIKDATYGLRLVAAEPEWLQEYGMSHMYQGDSLSLPLPVDYIKKRMAA